MTADEVLALIDGLRARGVLAFEGLGLKVALAELPLPRLPGQPHAGNGLVDAGGGIMVDPDALGHES
jgi:hypothetical protein